MERFLPGISCWLMSSSGMPAIMRTRLARPGPAAREPPRFPGFRLKYGKALESFWALDHGVWEEVKYFSCSLCLVFYSIFPLLFVDLYFSFCQSRSTGSLSVSGFLRVSPLLSICLLPSRPRSRSLSLSVLFFLGGSSA